MRGIDPHDLPRFADGLSFLYVEHCRIEQDNRAIAMVDRDGRTMVPVAALGALLLGPGTTLTHAAVTALADTACSTLWVGEQGVRLYSAGIGLARQTDLLERQARLWANQRTRLQVAKRLYQLRFPEESLDKLTLHQLRGREGARVRRAYRREAQRTGVEWSGRRYQRDQWESTDAVNQALSAATACMYGISHAAITALGCSPGLGFIHTGNALSFVYDVADLYKADIAIPAAFEATATTTINLAAATRRRCRDLIGETKLLGRIVDDIRYILGAQDLRSVEDDGWTDEDALKLWDPEDGTVPGGVNYEDER